MNKFCRIIRAGCHRATIVASFLLILTFCFEAAFSQSPFISQNVPRNICLMEGQNGSIVYTVTNPFSFDLYTYGYGIGFASAGPDTSDTLTSLNFQNGPPAYNTVIHAGQSISLTANYATAGLDYGTDFGQSTASIGLDLYTQPNMQGEHYGIVSPLTTFHIFDLVPSGTFPLSHISVVSDSWGVLEGESDVLYFYIVNREAHPFTITDFTLSSAFLVGDASDTLLQLNMDALNGVVIDPYTNYLAMIDFTTPGDGPEDPVDSGLTSVKLSIAGEWAGFNAGAAEDAGTVSVTDTPEPSAIALLALGSFIAVRRVCRMRN
jgi:hypothetical protein